jgi:hypothetical protein
MCVRAARAARRSVLTEPSVRWAVPRPTLSSGEPGRVGQVAAHPGELAGPDVRRRTTRGRRPGQQVLALGEPAGQLVIPVEGVDRRRVEQARLAVDRPREGGPDVVEIRAGDRLVAGRVLPHPGQVVHGHRPLDGRGPSRRGQLPHRVRQAVSRTGLVGGDPDEARVDQLGEGLEQPMPVVAQRTGDRLQVGQGDPAGKDGQHVEQGGGRVAHHGEAGLDGRAQRPLPGGQVPRAAGEQGQRPVQPVQQFRRGEQAHPRRGQLDGEGQPVEPAADRGHGGSVGVGDHEAGRGRPGSEKRDGIGYGQRREPDLPLVAHPQRTLAGGEHGQAG